MKFFVIKWVVVSFVTLIFNALGASARPHPQHLNEVLKLDEASDSYDDLFSTSFVSIDLPVDLEERSALHRGFITGDLSLLCDTFQGLDVAQIVYELQRKDKNHKTPLDCAMVRGLTTLHVAVLSNNAEYVKKLFDDYMREASSRENGLARWYNALTSVDNGGHMPIYYALKLGNAQLVFELIRNLSWQQYYNFFMHADNTGALLIQHALQLNWNFLHLTALHQDPVLVSIVRSQYRDWVYQWCNAVDKDGRTPQDIARLLGNGDVYGALLRL